jgi:hypothetical protein
MGKARDAFVPQPTLWREVFRVLRPGGYLASFFGKPNATTMCKLVTSDWRRSSVFSMPIRLLAKRPDPCSVFSYALRQIRPQGGLLSTNRLGMVFSIIWLEGFLRCSKKLKGWRRFQQKGHRHRKPSSWSEMRFNRCLPRCQPMGLQLYVIGHCYCSFITPGQESRKWPICVSETWNWIALRGFTCTGSRAHRQRASLAPSRPRNRRGLSAFNARAVEGRT